jgi:hypothetical protein
MPESEKISIQQYIKEVKSKLCDWKQLAIKTINLEINDSFRE